MYESPPFLGGRKAISAAHFSFCEDSASISAVEEEAAYFFLVVHCKGH